MAQMMNCIKFKPKAGSHDALYTAIAIYLRDYPLPDTVRLSAVSYTHLTLPTKA